MDSAPWSRQRQEYSRNGIAEDDLPDDPFELFRSWYADAATLPEPNAMVVATVSAAGQPSARTVLLKGLDARGFSFFTNLQSHKGSDLADNPRCALLFPWHALQRQVRVEGGTTLLPRDEVAAYFATRPRGAQLGAWASPQSQVVTEAELRERYAAASDRMSDAIEAPAHWGGYVVRPVSIEFWQGRENRMHDRWRYRRDGDRWLRQRL
ncbi:pyridoxamine 5'-phosphate oxidase, partial [Nocardioides jensenii]|uniref:pyridoxamine 5'-phosphate oxidase n=1 Tax=Nocardioides jensenii TaxID=1843 RepID=UPI000831F2CB